MRWDRLFADLEGQAEDVALDERDALVAELRDEEWGGASWRSLVGGAVELEVAGAGRIAGRAELVNETILRLTSPTADLIVAVGAVVTVLTAERRAEPLGRVAARLGWAPLLRQLRDDGEGLRITRRDGAVLEGDVDVVGRDFVRLADVGRRAPTVPFEALAVVTLRR